jgi:3-methyladenine DNA glycosylase AlkD
VGLSGPSGVTHAMTTSDPGVLVTRLVEVYRPAADPVRAAGNRAYMRDQFPYLGIPTAQRRALSRQVLAGQPRPGEAELRVIALACWDLPEREYQYFACDLLVDHAAGCSPGLLPTLAQLITTKSWWDTVDALASNAVGPIVLRHPATVSTMDTWLVADDLWLVRTALLHQLRYRERTDLDRLFRYCLAQAGHRDFFIRKAIGWALRQYAWTDPEPVRDFVAKHRTVLSPLSVREAVKNL